MIATWPATPTCNCLQKICEKIVLMFQCGKFFTYSTKTDTVMMFQNSVNDWGIRWNLCCLHKKWNRTYSMYIQMCLSTNWGLRVNGPLYISQVNPKLNNNSDRPIRHTCRAQQQPVSCIGRPECLFRLKVNLTLCTGGKCKFETSSTIRIRFQIGCRWSDNCRLGVRRSKKSW